MASNSEQGHAKNVANFGTLTLAVTGFGEDYKPTNASIKLPALETLGSAADSVLKNANNAASVSNLASGSRKAAFQSLGSLVTRVMNAIRSCGAKEDKIQLVQSCIRKIQGVRASPRKSDQEKAALLADGVVVKEISSSQMGFDNRLDNLDKLIGLLSHIPEYAPNENDLKINALKAYYNTLKAENKAAVEARNIYDKALLSRNETLYKPLEGLVDTAQAVKAYLKSLFGAASPKYKLVSGLAFKSYHF